MKKILSLVLIITMLFSTSAHALTYTNEKGQEIEIENFFDTKGHWAYDVISKWKDSNVIEGHQGYYKPNNNIYRRDVAVILNRVLGFNEISVQTFSDLENEQYYTEPILKLVALNAINYWNGRIRPHDYATREEVVYMIAKAFKIEPTSYCKKEYKDILSINTAFLPYVNALTNIGYIHGKSDNIFDPKANITRAEMIKIIDNISHGYYNKSGKYTDNYIGNALINSSGVNMYGSKIGGDIYFTYSTSGSYAFDTTDITGNIISFGKDVSITLQRSKINNLKLYGKTTINGADQINSIYVSKFANNSKVVGNSIGSITIEPETTINIQLNNQKETFPITNNTAYTQTYTEKMIKEMLLNEYGKLPDGPEIAKLDMKLNIYNRLTISETIINKGEADISKVFLVSSKNGSIPSLDDNDEKIDITKNLIKDKLNYVATKVTNSKDKNVYRIIVIDTKNLVAYSEPYYAETYDFSSSLYLTEESNINETMEIYITGKNIPDIKSVSVTYIEPGTSGIKEINLKKNSDSQDITRRINYIGTADFKTNIRYNFGYKITFANGEEKTYSNVKSVLYSDNTNVQGGLTLITGDFKITEPGAILISNNKIKNIGNEEILAYGIVEKICKDNEPKPILSKANIEEWAMSGIRYVYKDGLKTTYNANAYSELKYGEQMYYAAFINVSGGKYYFGDIKTTRGYTVPHIFNTTSTVIDEETVIVEVEYTSPIPIITHDRKSIEYFVGQNGAAYIQYWGEPLSSADVKINKDNNKMSLYFTDLDSRYQMDIRLELFSDYGKSENYAFSTPKSENYPKVIVDASGNVIKTNFNEKLKIINIIKNAQDLSGKINCIKGENGEIVKVEKTGVFYHPLIAIVEYKDGARTYTYNIQID